MNQSWNAKSSSTLFEFLPFDLFELIADHLEGHEIRDLLLCGSKRLSNCIYKSVRHFRFRLKQTENFPFYAFNLASPIEITVRLGDNSVDYPVLRGGRELLPLKPIPSLQKLDFAFTNCSSILAHREHLSRLFPSLTDLSLTRGGFAINDEQLESLPKTLRRLQLECGDAPCITNVSLELLSKLSQDLELLSLKGFVVHGSMDDLQLSDSLLNLTLSHVWATQLITKLPRYVEEVHIGLSSLSVQMEYLPVSVLPVTLRKFSVIPYQHKAPFVVDGPLPAHLEEWEAQLDWDGMAKDFKLPDSLQQINCDHADYFGANFERASKNLKFMDLQEKSIEAKDILNLPPFIQSLSFDSISSDALVLLPKTLTALHLPPPGEVGILKRSLCERLENLRELQCCLHYFESSSCLSVFKRLKAVTLSVSQPHLSSETDLFTHWDYTNQGIEEFELFVYSHCPWSSWISQLKPHTNLRTLYCTVRHEGFMSTQEIHVAPKYLKCLPPSLTSLIIPAPDLPGDQNAAMPIVSSSEFLECFRAFPPNLTELVMIPPAEHQLWLSDECFASLPPSLTQLELFKVGGLSDRFWDVIPPQISAIQVRLPQRLESPSFNAKEAEYLSKFEI